MMPSRHSLDSLNSRRWALICHLPTDAVCLSGGFALISSVRHLGFALICNRLLCLLFSNLLLWKTSVEVRGGSLVFASSKLWRGLFIDNTKENEKCKEWKIFICFSFVVKSLLLIFAFSGLYEKRPKTRCRGKFDRVLGALWGVSNSNRFLRQPWGQVHISASSFFFQEPIHIL